MEMKLSGRKALSPAFMLVSCLLVSYMPLTAASIATGQSTTTTRYAGWTSLSATACWSTDANITADCACLYIWQSLDCTLTKENTSNPDVQWRLRHAGYSTILSWMGNSAGFEDTLPADPFDLDKNNGMPSCPNLTTANPVNFGVGNKYKQQTDFAGSDLSQVVFQRHYNSLYAGMSMGLGPRWTHTYGSYITEAADTAGTTATVYRPDGKIYRFNENAAGWTANADIHEVLERRLDSQGAPIGWRYKTSENTVETYDINGRLREIADPRGIMQVLTYGEADNLLRRVDVSTGEYLDFRYDPYGRIESITDHVERSWGYRYGTGGLLEYVDNPDGTTRQYHYEDPGYPEALTGITDENGIRSATYGYDADGQADFSTLADNVERVEIVYEPDGQRTVTNSRGNTSTYTVISRMGMALPAQTSGPGCAGCGLANANYEYDVANNVTRVSVDGVVTEYGDYDTRGNPGYMIVASGTSEAHRTGYSYDPRFYNKLTKILEPSVLAADPASPCARGVDCRKVEYTYDSWGNRLTETRSGFAPDGRSVSRTTRYRYNGPLHQLSLIDGPRTDVEDITTFEYYPDDQSEGANRARLRRVAAANGMLLRDNIRYTPTGKIAFENRPNNILISNIYYPGNDRLQASIVYDLLSGNSNQTTWTYLPGGEVETITTAGLTPDATTVTFGYDNARRVTSITDGLGNSVEYSLDTEGNKTGERILDRDGVLRKALIRTFDTYNRLDISIEGADPVNPLEQVDSDYATGGDLDRQTDGNGVVTEFSYDTLGRLLNTTRDAGGLGATARYEYQSAQHLSAVTDAVNGQTRYEYDDLGNLLLESSPDSGVTTYSHDEAGNLKSRQDSRGQVLAYSYDALNRLTGLDAPGVTDDITYRYDSCENGIGRLCTITQGGVTVSYTYDPFGNVTSHQQMIYTYDAGNRIRTVAYPSGALVTYSYNAAGQASQVDVLADGITTTLAGSISYAPFGPVTELVFGNGVTLTQGLDTAYRLTSQFVPAVLDLGYTGYDGNGNLSNRTDSYGGSTNISFDSLNRVDAGNGTFGSREYDYDLNGNRTRLVSDHQTTTYGYTPGSNRMSTENSRAYTLDARGNVTHKLAVDGQGFVYSYNSHNRLVTAAERQLTGYTGKGRNRMPVIEDAMLATFSYNGLGQRVSKTIADGAVTQFLYGTDGALLVELDAAGKVQREYVYLNGQLLAVLDQVSTQGVDVAVIVDNGSAPSGWTSESSNKEYGADHLYSDGGSGNTVRWIPALASGVYDVYVWYVRNRKYSNSAPYTVTHNGMTDTVSVDQSSGGGSWQILAGNIIFDGSGDESVEVSDANGKTTADAIKFVDVSGDRHKMTKVSYAHNDHLGAPLAMTDETGAVVWRATYDPFGRATVTVNAVALNVRFPGQYFDAESGLHYNYFRYYDPETGRFITTDPRGTLINYSAPERQVAERQGIALPSNPTSAYINHIYNYVDNNPVMSVDPTGELEPVTVGFFIWGLLYVSHAGDVISLPNGNLRPGFDVQDDVCSLPWPIGPIADSCVLDRCIKHDACYEDNKCNFSSWGANLLGGTKPCNTCNGSFFD
jgi:RHS repeat-associated protein